MITRFSKWRFVLNHRVVIWYPKTTRECFMYGFRWQENFVGVVRRGDEIDPRQEVYYERVRNIAAVLEKEDDNHIPGPSGLQQKSAKVNAENDG